MLIDRGAIVQKDGGWVVEAEIETTDIPDNLHGLLLARIDSLSEEVKHTPWRPGIRRSNACSPSNAGIDLCLSERAGTGGCLQFTAGTRPKEVAPGCG